jgi:hypothetical protein
MDLFPGHTIHLNPSYSDVFPLIIPNHTLNIQAKLLPIVIAKGDHVTSSYERLLIAAFSKGSISVVYVLRPH